ncbi:hypothetical protein GCM10007877_14370 [Marinibactrum halimedae]|uniref:Phosphatidate phosphatase APP1 catalytic domain-containing protein n=2 Tax=Marinibactrum halimedae TaxID=1444977 RepID=A0AA37T5N0_9GAMM|nr:hypothetical protein GCM10007877_14370 [Marinibactrum halimedae]
MSAPHTFSNLKRDENLVFFHTDGYLDSQTQQWVIPIHGWVYEPERSRLRAGLFESILEEKFDLPITEENRPFFHERVNLLIADNERGKRITIELAGQRYTLPKSLPNGHFKGAITIDANIIQTYSHKGFIDFNVIMPTSDSRQFSGRVRLIEPEGLSIISDIDDTIKMTGVTNKTSLLSATFLQPFQAIDGMNSWYQYMAKNLGTTLHFVSSSPWQLYSPLLSLCEENDFPWASFSLKSVRFRDKTLTNLFKTGLETKPAQISEILEQFPNRKFILVGDSGEQDPEVYANIQARYPRQIQAIYIRNITNESDNNTRINQLNTQMKTISIQLFTNPNTLYTKGIK